MGTLKLHSFEVFFLHMRVSYLRCNTNSMLLKGALRPTGFSILQTTPLRHIHMPQRRYHIGYSAPSFQWFSLIWCLYWGASEVPFTEVPQKCLSPKRHVQLLRAPPKSLNFGRPYLNPHLSWRLQTTRVLLVEATSIDSPWWSARMVKGEEVDFLRTMAENGVFQGCR